jgi:hypothetical protein
LKAVNGSTFSFPKSERLKIEGEMNAGKLADD